MLSDPYIVHTLHPLSYFQIHHYSLLLISHPFIGVILIEALGVYEILKQIEIRVQSTKKFFFTNVSFLFLKYHFIG